MYPTSLGSDKERLVVKDRDGSPGQFLVRWDGENNKGVQFLLRDSADSTWDEVNMGANSLNTNQWVHISAVWNRSSQTAKLYVNGTENASSAISFSDTNEVSWPIALAGDSEGGDFENYVGKIDESKLHTKALTSEEVSGLKENSTFNSTDASADPTFSSEKPTDGSIGVDDTTDSTKIDVNTSIVVEDSDNSTLSSVSLCWGNGTCYYTESNVANGSTVWTKLQNLQEFTEFDWQVQADDGTETTTSGVYSFKTEYADPGSLVVNDTVQNKTYLDEAHDVQVYSEDGDRWAEAVGRDGPFGIVNITNESDISVHGGIGTGPFGGENNGPNTVKSYPDVDRSYVFGGPNISIINTSDKANPEILSFITGTGTGTINGVHQFSIGGTDYLLTASKDGYVCRMNITDRKSPAWDGCSSDGGVVPSPHDADILNGTDYAVIPSNDDNNGDTEFATMQFKSGTSLIDPSNYGANSTLQTPELYKANRVCTTESGDTTYVAADNKDEFGAWVTAINTSDPLSVSQIEARNSTGDFAAGCTIVNNEMLYVGSGNYVDAWNISDRANMIYRDAVTDPVFDGSGNPVGSSAHDLEVINNTIVQTAGQVDADALLTLSDTNYAITGTEGDTNSAPTISNLAATPNPVNTGETVNVTADITDSESSVDSAKCTLKDADDNIEVDNVSMSETDSDTYYCEYTTNDEDSDYGEWTATIWANDTEGAVTTDSTTFTVNTPPTPFGFSLNTTLLEPGDMLEAVASWSDRIGLANNRLETNESGTFQNQSVQSFSGTQIAVYREYETNDIKYVTESGNIIDTGFSGDVGGLGDITGDGNNEIAAKHGYITASGDYVDLGISTSTDRPLGEVCDVDGDDDRDITYLNANQEVSWVDANGNSGTTGVGFSGNGHIGGCGDIDGDGDIDVAFVDSNSDWTSGNLSYVDSEGNMETFADVDTVGVGGVADFNGDGNQQIGYDDGNLKFIDAAGNIEDTDTPSLPRPYGLAGDFDGDGDADHSYWTLADDRYLGIIDGANNTQKFTNTAPSRAGGMGSFADRSNATSTPSSTGLFGYRFWANNTAGQWTQTDTVTARVTNFPNQKNASLSWKNIGGSETQELEFGYNDPDGDEIASVSTPSSGTVTADNQTATVTGWTSPFDWAAKAIDRYGGESSVRDINVTLTEHHVQVENATGVVNESRQTVNTSVSVDVRGDPVNYSISASMPDVESTVRDDDETTTTPVTGTHAFTWYWEVDHITETVYGPFQDMSQGTADLDTQYVYAEKELANNQSVDFSRLTVTAPSMPGSCTNCDDRTVAVSGHTTMNETYNSSGDWLTSQEYDFSPQRDEVTLGISYLGDRLFEVANNNSAAFSGVDITDDISVPRGCSQTNNSAVDVGASTAANYSVEFSCDPGNVGDPGLVKTLDATDDNQTRYNYTTTELNITSNETRDTNVTWKIDKSELQDWSDRNNQSGSIDSNMTGVTVTDQPNTVRVTFTTDCCSSSPSQGIHTASLVYYVGEEDTTIEPSGGGGSGGTSGDDEDDDLGAELLPSTPYRVGYGLNITETMTVRNYKNVENRVQLVFDPRSGDACEYVSIREVTKGRVEDSGRISVNASGGFGDTGLVRVPPASSGLTGSSSSIPVQLKIRMPDQTTFERVKNENGSLSCRVSASVDRGTVNDIVLEVEPRRNPFTGMFVLGDQFVEAFLDTFFTERETCFGENNTALLTGNGTQQCPESAREVRQMPNRAGTVLIITVLVIGVIGLLYRYR